MNTVDFFRLQRFVDAQHGVYEDVVDELRRGKKAAHWVWYIFPQIQGLAQSEMSLRFAITSLEEARAYLQHPVLGARLLECTGLLLDHADRSITDMLGFPDDMKFRSCLTLFAEADPNQPVFQKALDTFFGGEKDQKTLDLLS